MKIHDLMKHNPVVITEDWTLEEAAYKMDEINAGVLPVVEGSKDNPSNNPVGVLTDRDIVTRCVAKGDDPREVKVSEVFTKDTVFCSENDKAKSAFDKMRENSVGRLLVKNSNEELAGIVSMADIIANAPESVWDNLGASNKGNSQAGV